MKRYGLGFVGAGAALVCFSMAGVALAQDISPPGLLTAQERQEINSTYIVQFSPFVGSSEVEGRANAIAARFNGQVKHVYTTVLRGFSIRMGEQALTRMIRTRGLDIASVSRDAAVWAVANPGAAKGGPPADKGPKNGGGGGGGSASCGESLGWDILRVTDMTQNAPIGDGKCDIMQGTTIIGDEVNDYSKSLLRVCVVDTGVSQHDDINVVVGTSAANFSNDKDSDGTNDLNGHGSHVAGTIGAIAGNGIGVVGVAPGVKIIPIKVLNRRGSGSLSGVIAGVNYAAGDPGGPTRCDIANLSLGASSNTTALDSAVQDAAVAGVKFALAAGNSAANIAGYTPARASTSDTDEIFTIASFGQVDTWSYFSNYDGPGAGQVDFILPGQDITSTWKDNSYNTISGTSMAAPHMAGLLVRYLTAHPGASVENADIDRDVEIQRKDYYTGDMSEKYWVAVDK